MVRRTYLRATYEIDHSGIDLRPLTKDLLNRNRVAAIWAGFVALSGKSQTVFHDRDVQTVHECND